MPAALLVIDVQEALFRTEPRPASADDVVARINHLIARAREAVRPVIFIQHETMGDGLKVGTQAWQLVKELDAQATDHTIRKTTPDSFFRTGLGELLGTLGVSRVVVCGYATEFCVDTTVRRAAALGYGVTLVADAHTTRDKAHATAEQIRVHHNATLPAISSFDAKIVALDADHAGLFQ